jgi:hypothetical protein
MARHLIVSEPFGDYTRGSRITDPKKIEAVLESDQAGHVLPIDTDEGESVTELEAPIAAPPSPLPPSLPSAAD